MKILKEGKAHKHMAWFCTCDTCQSELRILEGDPLSNDHVCFNCDASQYYIRYVCPVCRDLNKAYTSSSFGVKANAQRKEIMLTKEDREEMESWKTFNVDELSDAEVKWITNRNRV